MRLGDGCVRQIPRDRCRGAWEGSRLGALSGLGWPGARAGPGVPRTLAHVPRSAWQGPLAARLKLASRVPAPAGPPGRALSRMLLVLVAP